MSDLQCPATVLIARNGEAKSQAGGARSVDGVLTDKGRRQVHQLVQQVGGRRVAAVYSNHMEPAIESAELAASELGLRPVALDGLQELSLSDLEAGAPAAHDGHRVVRRFAEAITGIADAHRGESVLVFTHTNAMSLAIPWLCLNVRNDLEGQWFLPHCAVAEVEIDADGWRLVSWPEPD
jgi:probable phosphoglycerate mutase